MFILQMKKLSLRELRNLTSRIQTQVEFESKPTLLSKR